MAERDFKGIWISKEIWMSKELSLMEKVLFVEIHSLDNKHGCFASNRYFAEFFGVSPRQISTHIASLKEKGFITVQILNQNDRTIHAAGKFARVRDEDLIQLRQEKDELIHKMTWKRKKGGNGV
jgi:DNA-binding transcriptional ArsR family regulator